MPIAALLLLAFPVAEILLLIAVGRRIGGWWTLLAVLAVGLLGAALARRQGLAMARRLQAELAAGRPPSRHVAESVLVLLAGVLFIVPGFLSDALAVLCLVPWTRRLILRVALAWLRRAEAQGRLTGSAIHVRFGVGGKTTGAQGPEGLDSLGTAGGGGIRDVRPEDVQVRGPEPRALDQGGHGRDAGAD